MKLWTCKRSGRQQYAVSQPGHAQTQGIPEAAAR